MGEEVGANMKWLAFVMALLLLVALAGCGRSAGQDFSDIKYSVTGGIAGFDQRMVISADGSFQLADRAKTVGAGRLAAKDLKALQAQVAKVRWASLAQQYVDPKVADALLETVTVTIGTKTYTVTVGTGGNPPDELKELLGQLKATYNGNRP